MKDSVCSYRPATTLTCGAAGFLRAGGPSEVPFRICCVAAIIRAERTPSSAMSPVPFLCAGAGLPRFGNASPAEGAPAFAACASEQIS